MITNDYGMAERQIELLQFMKEVDKVFEKNGIQYSLCGGTLLGAIRHNGFIPWDDDLDIMCDRHNFEKMLSLFNSGVDVISFTDSMLVIKRILWVYRIQRKEDHRDGLSAATVDVMVMDNCPDNSLVRIFKVMMIKILQGMMHEKLEFDGKSFFMKLCLIVTFALGKFFSDAFKFRIYNRVSQIGNKKKTQFLTGYNDLFKTLNCRYDGNLMQYIVKHPFEDTVFPITHKYDSYIKTQYGDYLTPPPENERVPIHI